MKLKYTFDVMQLDDEYVAVPLDVGDDPFRGVIKTNDTGAAILSILNESVSIEEIMEKMMEIYHVDSKEDLQKLIISFVKSLEDKGLIEQ